MHPTILLLLRVFVAAGMCSLSHCQAMMGGVHEKIGKKKQKIIVMGDSHARGLAKKLKYTLNHEL
jgi:sulfite exporter TauE/SafE